MFAIMKGDPPQPSTVDTKIAPVWDDILRKALAKKPEERYATAKEFAQAVKDAAGPLISREPASSREPAVERRSQRRQTPRACPSHSHGEGRPETPAAPGRPTAEPERGLRACSCVSDLTRR